MWIMASETSTTITGARPCCGPLEQGLGDAFTAEVKAAWTDTYTLLAEAMKAAAAEQAA
jgi:hypothetical protein